MKTTSHFLSCISWSLILVAVSQSFATEVTPARKLANSPGVLIIAHRGNSSVAPENTLPAFAKALEAKADLVELDYHHSSDGVPVVIHDDTLDRTTNSQAIFGKVKLPVATLSTADIAKVDAGLWFGDAFAGAKLPTLAESLATIQTGSTTLVERKAGDAATLVKLLEQEKLIDKVVVQSFDWEFVKACRALSPTLTLCTLSGKAASDEQIEAAAATGADVIVWNHEKLRRDQIGLIHKLGKKAWVYTIDDPDRVADFIAAGIDGVITNKPATMIKVRSATKRAAE